MPLISVIGLINTVGLRAIIILVFLNPASAGTSTGTLSAGTLEVVVAALAVAIVLPNRESC